MMSQEELLPWSEPDTNFFADNLLGIEDWGDSITDIKLGEDDVLLCNNDHDMEVNPDELSELLQNFGDDMWALSEDTIKELGEQIKQEPPSPSSSTSSLISIDSSLPSSPESQLLNNGQWTPPHQPYTNIQPLPVVRPIKTETNLHRPPTCIRTEANLALPLSEKNVFTCSVIKSEVSVTPSCIIKKEPITIQPCSLVKPLPNMPVGHVQKITLQNGQQPKLIQQGKGGVTSTTANITYIPVSGTIPTNAILIGNKPGLAIAKPITSVVDNAVPTAVKLPHNNGINEKVMKRQQRMIKNRESACLSRRKKKEYLQSLEWKVKEVTHLNDKLNEENMKLKHRVAELEKENLLLKSSHPNWSSTAKKSTCVLAVLLFVALNLGPFSSLKDSWKFSSPDNLLSVRHGRALLQFQEDSITNKKQSKPLVYGPLRQQYTMSNGDSLNTKPKDTTINMNTQRKDLIVVKKKWDFLADMNRKKAILAKKERRLKNTLKRNQNKAKIIERPVCPTTQVNTTESIRLNEALGDWIHKYQDEKISRKSKQPLQRNKIISAVKQLALRLTPNCTEAEARRKIQRHMFTRRHNAESSSDSSKNAVQLFQGPDWLKVFSEAINRQDDTLYIVSFRQDHLMFPATKSNVTQRPKMSLMMMAPTNGTTVNVTKDQESISMIQIDCEVVDTKHIKIKKSSLPMPFADSLYHYRPATKPAEHTPSIPTTHTAK